MQIWLDGTIVSTMQCALHNTAPPWFCSWSSQSCILATQPRVVTIVACRAALSLRGPPSMRAPVRRGGAAAPAYKSSLPRPTFGGYSTDESDEQPAPPRREPPPAAVPAAEPARAMYSARCAQALVAGMVSGLQMVFTEGVTCCSLLSTCKVQ